MKDGGRIILIGSNTAVRTAFSGSSVYSMSKAALTGLVRGAAIDLAPRAITVNNMQPVVISVLCYLCYAYAPKITKVIPPSTAHGILRVVAFVLLCIGVQIAWNGLSALLATTPGAVIFT
jgi:NADP-dependent 3-hydroxy acid dehydrogenase YdfG